MDERKHNHIDPWDDGAYGIGSTKPPKNHGGLIALLLITVICLGGITSALGILNIRLFKELVTQPEASSAPLSFSDSPEGDASGDDVISASAPASEAETDADASIDLNDTPVSQENIPQEGGLSWQQVYDKNIDSVVSISCSSSNGSSSGTGVIFSANGYIVTNSHVVENAQTITVLLTDQRTFTATLVGADPVSDLAVLRIQATGLTPAEFGDSGQLRVGDAVAAIGDPLGAQLRGTMTDGIVSAINRDVVTGGRTLTLIQTNAALNSGNSGGPLLNCYGQVVGINTMKISAFADSTGVEGLGFAIPSTTVKEIVDQLISQGYVSGRPTLGITGEEISSFYQRYYRFPAGLYITEVAENSSAEALGLQPGDILVSIDGTQITDQDTLNSVIYAHEAGDTVEIVIYRGGRQYSASLTLDEAKG